MSSSRPTSNYSFLRGASHPAQLVVTADALGLEAIGITDRNSLAGVVRAWAAARDIGARSLTGCRLDFIDGTPSLLCYPSDREAYARLCRLLSVGQSGADKGECDLLLEDFLEQAEGQLCLIVPPERLDAAFETRAAFLAQRLRGRVWLAASRLYGARDLKRLHHLAGLAERIGAPMVATGDVLYHAPERRPLQDVLTCIRETCAIHEAGFRLEANAERHVKSPAEMERLFARWPEAVARSVEIAKRIAFDLGALREEYPDEPVPPGRTAMQHLTDLAWSGAAWRYPAGIPDKVTALLHKELKLIAELDYPNYFLTVHDIVQWARARPVPILCQGRGSAANSVVCFCLGVTAVDPTEEDQDLLFCRFLSKERGDPPDIDVDFEHERREEVMQYVYQRYGRHRAAICGTVIHYRPRSAIRDVGKALGLTEDITAALANTVWGSWGGDIADDHIRQAGLDPHNPEIVRATTLASELLKFPPPPVAACGRLRPDQAAAERDRADRQRRDEGPHLHPVGQGRHRRPGADEGRCAGPGHADLHEARLRPAQPAPRRGRCCATTGGGRSPDIAHVPQKCPQDLRDALPRRFHRRLPGREPGADVDAAPAQAAEVL
jgi:error-prone DNA polymerase